MESRLSSERGRALVGPSLRRFPAAQAPQRPRNQVRIRRGRPEGRRRGNGGGNAHKTQLVPEGEYWVRQGPAHFEYRPEIPGPLRHRRGEVLTTGAVDPNDGARVSQRRAAGTVPVGEVVHRVAIIARAHLGNGNRLGTVGGQVIQVQSREGRRGKAA